MFFRSLKIGRFKDVDVLLHWTMWVLPLCIGIRAILLYPAAEVVLQAALMLGVYACILLHEFAHMQMARWVRLGVRSVRLYPFGSSAKLMEISERPWKEIWVAAAGPFAHGFIAGAIAAMFAASELNLSPNVDAAEPFWEAFFNRLFWLNVLLAALHLIPAFPFDGGQIFRGALALSAQRLRATEVASMLSSFVALFFLIPGMLWMSSVWWLILVGIVIHISAQQELMAMRYVASLQDPEASVMASGASLLVAVDQVLDEDDLPREENFSGLIWSPRNRLWVVWRKGQPVSAHALVGE